LKDTKSNDIRLLGSFIVARCIMQRRPIKMLLGGGLQA